MFIYWHFNLYITTSIPFFVAADLIFSGDLLQNLVVFLFHTPVIAIVLIKKVKLNRTQLSFVPGIASLKLLHTAKRRLKYT